MDNALNRVSRVRVSQQREEVILDNIPAGIIHNGGIMTFAPDKSLIIGVGVQNEIMEKAQDLNWLGGKILRIFPDGTIPENNPFEDSPILSYGHRNIFGLAIEKESGRLFACEEGPDKDDEINLIEGGGNYGWPEVTGKTDDKDYVNPIHTYTPVITPTQCCFVDQKLYHGSYNEGTVHRLTFNDDFTDVIADDVVYRGRSFGVIGVFYGPDENFYITTPNKIMKIDV
jgi:glucose/arabinose dehydrogenase